MSTYDLILVGFGLILLGMFLMFLSIVVEASRREDGKASGEAGGVVIIGPVPIVFGTSQRVTKIVLILAIVLTALALALFLLMSYTP